MKSVFKTIAALLLCVCSPLLATTPIVDASFTGNAHVVSGATLYVDAGANIVITGSLSGVQTTNANLTAIAGLTTTANSLTYWTGSGAAAQLNFTAFSQSLLPLASSQAWFDAISPVGAVAGDIVYFNGTHWVLLTGGTNGQVLETTGTAPAWVSPISAPADATYITETANGTLSNEFALSSLTPGILKVGSGGIPATAAAGIDYLTPGAIGVTVQAYNSNLATWAGLTPPSGGVVGTTDTQTLTNKTFTSPAISSPTFSGTFAPPIVSSDPGSPTDGLIWYNSTASALKAQIAGSTVSLGAGGGGGIGGSTGSTDMAILIANGTGGSTIQASTLTISSGVVGWPSNTRQTFSPGSANSGLNVGSVSSDPTTLSNGDIWYNSTALALKARINGATVSLSGGGSGNVTGPASSTTNGIAVYSNGTGQVLLNTSSTISSGGVLVSNAVGAGGTPPTTAAFYALATGVAALPATSGTSQSSGHVARFGSSNNNSSLDIGQDGSTGCWLQVVDRGSPSSTHPLLLQPIGDKTIFGGAALSSSSSAGVGYTTGAGGTVTQTTSRTTGVTINDVSGLITLVSAAGSSAWQTFTVTDSSVSAADTVSVSQVAGTDVYLFSTRTAAGSFNITFATTGGTTTESPTIKFNVHKGSNS